MANIEHRRSRDGTPSYRVKIRLKGQPPISGTFSRLTDARRWEQSTEAAIREGRYFKTAEAKRHTLGDLVDRYIEEGFTDRLKSGQDRKRQLLWWKAQIGNTLLSDLSAAVIVECRNRKLTSTKRNDKLLSPSTVARYLAALSHALAIAVRDWEWLDDSPARKVTKPRQPRGRERFLSDAERNALLAACKASESRFLYTVVVLALSTGMRRGEIMSLRWPQVDFRENQIRLRDTKNGSSRSVPLSGLALDLLRELSKVRRLDSDLLFPGERGDKPVELKRPWTTACQQAKLIDFRFHDLRHSAASYLAMNGASTIEIAAVLGHKTLQMVKRYSHLTNSHTAQVVAAMNEKIFGRAANE